MRDKVLNVIIIIGLLLIVGAVTVFKDFEYQQYLRYGGAILIAFGFMFDYDKVKVEKKSK
ncbi:hypothetical protein KY305_13460 [Bacillus sp. YC2]|uniref:hypothetical protein n=1 Tax=Bacillus sp. YC2 TaxID=2861287 RepID=UPI001CA711C5|nr:hypothetical protein [Bacillus sp. YC2]MBY8913746.1 hypothetical protein [Bacillus sp. YC2]